MKKLLVILLGLIVLAVVMGVCEVDSPSSTSFTSKTSKVRAQTSKIRVQTSKVRTQKWFQGGSLHKSNVAQWKKATYRNKLATCGDFLSILWKEHLNTKEDFQKLKVKAHILVGALDMWVSLIPDGDDGDYAPIAAMAVIIIRNRDDLGQDS